MGYDPSCVLPDDMQSILEPNSKSASNVATRLCCTLGPNSRTVEVLEDLLRAGMHIARLDLSWGSIEYHQETLDNLRVAMRNTGQLCAVMADTNGPENLIRKSGKGVLVFNAEDRVVLTTDSAATLTNQLIPILPSELCSLAIGSTISLGMYLSSGDMTTTAKLTVESLEEDKAVCVVQNSAELDAELVTLSTAASEDEAPLTEEDVSHIKSFFKRNNIEAIGLSYCRSAEDVDFCRAVLAEYDMEECMVFAKIENLAGLKNHEAILETADAVVFSRGNLGVQLAPEKTFMAQRLVIQNANMHGKPVFVTRLCDSMVDVPRPTRAEATDVANLVLNGADGIILGKETFNGLYPVECAETVMSICGQAENNIDNGFYYQRMLNQFKDMEAGKGMDFRESLASTAVRAVEKLGAKLLIAYTNTGTTPRILAKYKPGVPILAVVLPQLTNDGIRFRMKGHLKSRQVYAYRGVIPLLAQPNSDPSNPRERGALLNFALDYAKRTGLVDIGDLVVIQECPRTDHSGLVKSIRLTQDLLPKDVTMMRRMMSTH